MAAPAEQAPPAQPEPSVGAYDFLHISAKNLMAQNFMFSGIRLSISKPLGMNFMAAHSIVIDGEKSFYKFAPTYVGTIRQKSQQESYPVCLGEVTTEGNVVSQVIHEPIDNLKLKFQSQSSSKEFQHGQIEADYDMGTSHIGVKLVNVNPVRGSGIWVFNYLKKITDSVAMGGDLTYQYSKGQFEVAMPSFGGRYQGKDWTFAGTVSTAGALELSYMQKLSDTARVATTLEFGGNGLAANAGVQYNFNSGVFRSQITSGGSIVGCLERKLQEGITMLLNGSMNHVTGKSTVGVGLVFGQ